MYIQPNFRGTQMAINKTKIKNTIKAIYEFILNPRLLLCFGLAWLITNGWAYIAVAFGAMYDISALTTIGATYLAFLWLPVTPEKIITVIISIHLLKKIYPEDTKTLAKLYELKRKAKRECRKVVLVTKLKWRNFKRKIQSRKERKNQEKS
jgi:hypothetical protein